MKKTVLLLALCAALCAMLASCSQLQTSGETTTVSIDGKALMARSATLQTWFENNPKVESTLIVEIFYDGEYHTTTKTATLSQLHAQTHKIPNIPIGKTVDIYCDLISGSYFWGKAEGVKITAATHDITIKMNDEPSDMVYCNDISGVYEIPYGYTDITNKFTDGGYITTLIIPRSVKAFSAGLFNCFSGVEEVIFKDTRSWRMIDTTNPNINALIDVSDPVRNAIRFKDTDDWGDSSLQFNKN